MKALIEALEKNPAVARAGASLALRRRRCCRSASALGVAAEPAPATGRVRGRRRRGWRASGSCRPRGGESARQAAIHRAFLASGKTYAARRLRQREAHPHRYARAGDNMYREACEATHVRGEQSAEVLDLRMTCLQERLGGLRALTQVFSDANGEVVENAVSAANALGTLDRCADVPLLRSVVRPPEDPATRARVEELSPQLASVKALLRGRELARGAEGWPALVDRGARARLSAAHRRDAGALGRMYCKVDRRRGRREGPEEAFWRPTPPAMTTCGPRSRPIWCGSSAISRDATREAQRWAKHADADAAAPGRARPPARVAAQQHGRAVEIGAGRRRRSAATTGARAQGEGAGARITPTWGSRRGTSRSCSRIWGATRRRSSTSIGPSESSSMDSAPGILMSRRSSNRGEILNALGSLARRAHVVREGAHHLGA